ncbi:hypothetical protein BV898_05985 [Hypsibius exemplaris]|uniref:EF-hand domain-containing protein n=1 Tax=Hypsibius exemplaris TaxID=2072580 RepID=A0A1W0WXQ1_HYPEX|nr:hypothetical protein BV898_05985 [Hypsibius exemplaris]
MKNHLKNSVLLVVVLIAGWTTGFPSGSQKFGRTEVTDGWSKIFTRNGEDIVEALDRDADGKINQTESRMRFGGSSSRAGWDKLSRDFDRLDLDGDGYIIAGEFDAERRNPQGATAPAAVRNFG